jgi:hypothetical protein
LLGHGRPVQVGRIGAGRPEEHPDGRGHHHECRDAGE